MIQLIAGLINQLLPNGAIVNNTAPIFAGIDSVTPNGDGSFSLSWLAASGTALNPIRYNVYVSQNATTLFDASNITQVVHGLEARVYNNAAMQYFVKGQEYFFGVRAESANGFMENNTVDLPSTAIASGDLPAVLQDIATALQGTATQTAATEVLLAQDHVNINQDHLNLVADHENLQAMLLDLSDLLTTLSGLNSSLAASSLSIDSSATTISESASIIDDAVTSINASAVAIANTQELLAADVSTLSGQLSTLAGYLTTFAGQLTELGEDVTAINDIIIQLDDIVIALTNIIIPDYINGQVNTTVQVGCGMRTTVYKGEDKKLDFQLIDKKTGGYFDLTAASEISIIFQKQDGYQLVKKLTNDEVVVDDAALGKFHTALLPADTVLLMQGDPMPVEIRVTISGLMTIVQIPEALNVIDSLLKI